MGVLTNALQIVDIAPQVEVSEEKRERVQKIVRNIFIAVALSAMALFFIVPVFADENDEAYIGIMSDILQRIVSIVGMIFQAIGIILSIYAVGQLILAFKNEDANAKSSASMLLVVGIALIAVPAILTSLNIQGLLGTVE